MQAWLDDNPLSQGLAKLQSKLKQWQASLSKLGAEAYGGELPEPFAAIARFATSPAGAFTALLGAAKYTAEAREEMFKMSETTDVAVDKLSALAYAARRAGVSNEALAAGLRKMQGKEFQAMLQGIGGKAGGKAAGMQGIMAGLGLDKSKDAVDQLRQITQQFEKLDSVSRIGLARNLGISELLPLINQGIANLDAFTQRARDLGLVMSESDAKAGKQFGLAMGDLHEVLMSSVSAIGGALVPLITGLTNIFVRVTVAVRDWIKDHQALTQAIFYGTGAIVGAGLAVKILSIAIGYLAPIITNPWLLATAAIAGVGVGIIALTGEFPHLSALWKGLAADSVSSFSAITNALSKGDIEAAWNVVTGYLSTEWTRLCNTLQSIWEDYRTSFTQAYYGMLAGWNNICAQMKTSFENLITGVKNLWASTKEALGSKFTSFFEDTETAEKLRRQQAAARARGINPNGGQGVSTGNEVLSNDMRRERAGNNAANKTAVASIEADRRAEEERLGAAVSAAAKARDARLAAAEADLQKKREALNKAQAAANVPGKEDVGGRKGNQAFAAAAAAEIRGTFSGAVAGMLGGGGDAIAQKQVDLQQEANELHRKSTDLIEKLFYVQDETCDNLAAMLQSFSGVY